MAKKREARITVLLTDVEMARFRAYCDQKGFKKSTLIARLIREHLDGQGFTYQAQLPLEGRENAR